MERQRDKYHRENLQPVDLEVVANRKLKQNFHARKKLHSL